MRALIVGLGSIGRRHARNWSALGYGAAGGLPPAQRAATRAAGRRGARVSPTWIAALERERPDVVLVTNPTSLHVPAARQAVDAGAHVLRRKAAGELTWRVSPSCSRRRGRVAERSWLAYNLRFHPGLARMRALVERQAIGRIVSARAEAGEYLPDWHPWEDYRHGYSARRRSRRRRGADLQPRARRAVLAARARPHASRPWSRMPARSRSTSRTRPRSSWSSNGSALGSVHVDYVRRAPRRTIETRSAKMASCDGTTSAIGWRCTQPMRASGGLRTATRRTRAIRCTWTSCAISSSVCVARSATAHGRATGRRGAGGCTGGAPVGGARSTH